MPCDLCEKAVTHQDVTINACHEHADSLREAYFAYRAEGHDPHMFRVSQQKADAVKAAKQ